jgi:putative ABC transport system permease protein
MLVGVDSFLNFIGLLDKKKSMLKNYFKIAIRNLWKNKLFSAINITGLAIGMASSMLLFGWVAFQLSYDNFHAKKKDIYRIALDTYQHNSLVFKSAENYAALGPALKADLPEVMDAARLYNMGSKNNCVFTYHNTAFKETKFLYADASFLTIFSFPFMDGDPKSALAEPYTAVISESISRKFFGNEKAIGKFIQMDDDDRNSELCKITGVFKDVPENSHLKFNILISYPTLYHRKGGMDRFENNWNQKDFYTYVLLRPGTDIKSLESALPSFINKHIPNTGTNQAESKLELQPLQKIHLKSNLNDEPEANGNQKVVLFIIIIAIFIITIAWVNYINLSTAGSLSRAKEIGIRKVLGSKRAQLIKQFLTESLSVNLISFGLALTLMGFLRPLFSKEFNLDFSFGALVNNDYGPVFISFLIMGAFLSGLYPSFILSSYQPALMLKGKLTASKKGLTLRRFLVVFQFSLSIFLIIGTVIIYQQVHFMLHQNLGMKLNQVLVMDRPGHWDKSDSVNSIRVQRFKQLLKSQSSIETVAMSDAIPGKEVRSQLNYRLKNSREDKTIPFNTIGVDEDYLHLLNMNILAGRNFSKEVKTDEDGLIITESASVQLGFKNSEDAIGKQLLHNNVVFSILGVVDDFHQQSLEKKVEPVVFQYNGNDYEADEYYLVKLKTTNIHRSVDYIQGNWKDIFPGNPFGFFFLDEFFNEQYKNESQFGALFGTFSMIAIVIACTGLFALVAFMIEQRTKEIGIRKVLGASLQDVIILLTAEFVKLLLLANLIAWPFGWILMNTWLSDFAYRINISWWIFVFAGLSAVILALLTIGFQAIKAGLTNPVKSLRMT